MSLPLTPERLRLAYDFLADCPPFDKWNLPAGEDVKFRVIRKHPTWKAFYTLQPFMTITVVASYVLTTHELIEAMAHEMIHLHEDHNGFGTEAAHSKAFWILAKRVCKIHGFDFASF
jgi:predicted metallopeptidase